MYSVIVPTLGRTEMMMRLLFNLYMTTSKHNVEVVVVTEDPETQVACSDQRVTLVKRGGNAVEKWNLGAAASSGSWLVLLGDDCVLSHGWLDLVERTDNKGFIGLYEGVTWVEAVGHYAISKDLACRVFGGCLALPPYKAGYFDQEVCLVMHRCGCYAVTPGIALMHNHPSLGLMEPDETYRLGQERQEDDRVTFYERRRAGFPVTWEPCFKVK